MRRRALAVGELVGIEPGYDTGIWLRNLADEMDVIHDGRVLPDETVVVLEVRGDAVRIVNHRGVSGWTWMNRLRKLG